MSINILKQLIVTAVPGSSVGIVTAYWLDGPGIKSRCGVRFSAPVHTGPEAHPASCTMGTGSFPGVKRPGHDAEPSPLPVPRTKNGVEHIGEI